MERNLEVMKRFPVELGLSENKSAVVNGWRRGQTRPTFKVRGSSSDFTILSAARNAIAVNEHNAKMAWSAFTQPQEDAGCPPAAPTKLLSKKLDLPTKNS